MLVAAMEKAGLFASRPDGARLATDEDAAKILAIIDATAVDFVDGILVARADPHDVLQATLADADMTGLGSSNGPFMSLLLFAEIQSKTGKIVVPGTYAELRSLVVDQEAFAGYMEGQARLHENHRYLTAPMQAKLSAGLERNALWVRDAAERAKDGDLTYGAALDAAARRLDRSFAITPESHMRSESTLEI